MISDLLCTTVAPIVAPAVPHGLKLPLKSDAMSAGHFNGSWRPLSTDPAIQVPSLVVPAKRSW
jgi:hypothetical protein